MNQSLIKQLEQLNPTEGEWRENGVYIESDEEILYESLYSINDDDTLVALAPAMRLAILEMAKEIEDIKSTLQVRLNLIQSETSEIVRETMIQNLLIDI